MCSKKCSTVLLEADTADKLVLFSRDYSLTSTAQASVRPVTHVVHSSTQHGLLTWLRLLWCMLLALRKRLKANTIPCPTLLSTTAINAITVFNIDMS